MPDKSFKYMAEEKSNEVKKQVKKKSSGKKKILRLLIGLPIIVLIIIVGLLMYVTSDAFFQKQIVPRVNSELGGEVKVAKSKVSPLSQFQLQEVSVKSTNKTDSVPVFQMKELDVQYDALKFLTSRALIVNKVLVDSPTIHFKKFADGSSNADFKATEPKEKEEKNKPESGGKTPEVSIRNVEIRNANVTIETQGEDGNWAIHKFQGFNFSIDELGNGKKGAIKMSSGILSEAGADKLVAALDGAFNLELNQSLIPVNAGGALKLDVKETAGQMSELSGVSTTLDVALTPTSLDNLSLQILRNGSILGVVKASGPYDAEKGEADIKLVADNINKNVLNLLAVGSGGGFGNTAFSLNASYKGTGGFQKHDISGTVNGSQIQWVTSNSSTPLADLAVSFKAAVDAAASKATISALDVSVKQGVSEIIKAHLDKEVNVDYGKETPAISDAGLNASVNGLDIGTWLRGLDPASPIAGVLNSTLALVSKANGENISLNLNAGIDGLSTGDVNGPVHNASVRLTTTATVTGMKNVNADTITLAVNRPSGPLMDLNATASYAETGTIKLNATSNLHDPKSTSGPEKLNLTVDTKIAPDAISINGISLGLTPTQKVASNNVNISGTLPGSEKPDLHGKIDVISQGLDVTRVMNFVNSLSPKKEKKKDEPKKEKGPEVEPAPIELPFKHLVTDVKIDKLVADKLTASNIHIKKTINNGKLNLNPIQLDLFGVPVRADMAANLSVPGYEYDLNLDMSQFPLTSLFALLGQTPDPKNHGGEIDLKLGLTGKGITSPNLKKNLKGRTNLNMDGGNMAISGGFKKYVILPIATVLRIDPILDGVVKKIKFDAEFGGGALNLKDMLVSTDPFQISTSGSVGVADQIETTSFKLPLTMSLRRDIAKSANFLPSKTPESQQYVPLPDFVSLVGSFSGIDKVAIDKTRIAQMLLQSAAGLPGETLTNAVEMIGDPAGTAKNLIKGAGDVGKGVGNIGKDITKGVGSLIPGLGKKQDKESSETSTNAPSKGPGGLLKGIFQ